MLRLGLRYSISKLQFRKRCAPERLGTGGEKGGGTVGARAGIGGGLIMSGGQRDPGIQTTGHCSSSATKEGEGSLDHKARRGQGAEEP